MKHRYLPKEITKILWAMRYGIILFLMTSSTVFAQESIVVNPQFFMAEAIGDTIVVEVNSNVNWNVSSSDIWVSFQPASGTNQDSIEVIISPNPLTQSRSDTLVFSNGVISDSMLITQSPGSCAAPDGLLADSVSIDSAFLSWNAVAGAQGYILQYRRDSTNDPWTIIDTLTQNALILSGLDSLTSYEWIVQTQCEFVSSVFSDTAYFRTKEPCRAPDADSLNATLLLGGDVRLEWSSYNFAAAYGLRFRELGTTTWTEIDSVSVTDTLLTGIPAGLSYEWQVRSICCDRSSEWSVLDTFSISSCVAPIILLADSISSNRVTMIWDTLANADFYQVQYRVQGEVAWNVLAPFAGSDTTLTDLTSETTYEWQVRSICDVDSSEWVSGPEFTTLSEEDCGIPGNPLVDNITDSSAQVSWTAVVGASGYEVRYRESGTTDWLVDTVFSQTDTVLSGLMGSTFYEWEVMTICGDSTSIPVPGPTFETQANPSLCSSPSDLAVSNITDSSVQIIWTGIAEALNYEIQYRLAGANDSSVWQVAGTDTILQVLLANTTYEWRVRTICVDDSSDWIPGPNFTTLETPVVTIDAPENNATVGVPFQVLFTVIGWEVAENSSHFHYFVNDVDSGAVYSLNPLTIDGLTPGTYEIKLVLADQNHNFVNAADSITVEVVNNPTLSLNPELLIFPAEGDTLAFFVDANVAWNVSQSPAWVSFITSSGTGSDSVYVIAGSNTTANSRGDTIIVSGGGISDTLGIFQFQSICTPPQGLLASDIKIDSVTLSWETEIDAQGYILEYRRDSTGDPWTVIDTITQPLFILSGLDSLTSYVWRVTTKCDGPDSQPSDTAFFRTKEPCFAPTPDSMLATILPNEDVRLGWDSYVYAAAYGIRYRELGATNWTELDLVGKTDTVLTGLVPNTDYEWQVRSFCCDRYSDWSVSDTFRITTCTAPTGLSVATITDSSAQLIWNPVASVFSYDLRYSVEGTNNWTVVTGITQSDTTVSGLLSDTNYQWELRSICADDTSDWVAGLPFTTLGLPAIAILFPLDNATVAVPFNVDFTISNWDVQPNGRRIRYFIDGIEGVGPVFDLQPINIDLLANGQHTIRLELAEADNSLINVSDSITVTVIDNVILDADSAFFLAAGVGDTLTFGITSNITWTVSPGANWITSISPNGTGDGTVSLLVQANPTLQSRADTVIITGGGLADTVVVFQFQGDCETPDGLLVDEETLGVNSAELSWFPVTGVAGYELRYRKDSTAEEWTVIDNLTEQFATLNNLEAITSYVWQVRSNCDPAVSAWSQEAFFRTEEPCFPPDADSIMATILENDNVQLLWGSYLYAAAYGVRYREVGANNWNEIDFISRTDTILSNLVPNIDYEWQVRSFCCDRFSEWSVADTFAITSCNAPTGLSATNITDSSAQLIWNPAENALTYTLRIRESGTNNWTVYPGITQPDTIITGLTPEITYEWELRLFCNNDSSNWIPAIPFTTLGLPMVEITSPLNNALVVQPFEVIFTIENWDVQPNGRHFHYFIDGIDQGPVFSTDPLTMDGLAEGQHSIRIQLSLEDHTLIDVMDSVLVQVVANPVLAADPDSLIYNENGNVLRFGVNSNISWTVNGDQPWITLTPLNGTLNDSISVIVPPNPALLERTGLVIIAGGGLVDTVVVYQTPGICDTPDGLAFADITTEGATLSWDIIPDVQGYEIRYRRDSTNDAWTVLENINQSPFALTGLEGDTPYEWQVRTICDNLTSNWSGSSYFRTEAICFAPSNLQVSNITTTSAQASWILAENAVSYALRYRVIGTQNWTRIDQLTEAIRLLADLLEETNYEWEVKSICENDSSDWVSGPEFITLGSPSLTILSPENNAQVGVPFDVQFEIQNWPLTPNGRRYRYFIDEVDQGAVFNINPLTIDNLAIGMHEVKLMLADENNSLIGVGDSIEVEVVENNMLAVNPEFLIIPAEGDTVNIGVTSNVAWTISGNQNWVMIDPVSGNGNDSVAIMILANDQTQSRSDTIEITGGGITVSVLITQFQSECGVPQGLLTKSLSPQGGVATWTKVPGASGYEIRYRQDSTDDEWTVLDTLTQNQYEITGLFENTPYQWQVRTVCGNAFSDWSTLVYFRTVGACSPPVALQVDNITDSSVQVAWTVVANANGYELRYRIVGENVWTTMTNITTTDTVLSGLMTNTNYEWQARTSCEEGFSEWVDGPEFELSDAPESCGEPSNLTVNNITDSTALLSWMSGAMDTTLYFRFAYQMIPGGERIVLDSVAMNSQLLEGLMAGAEYMWEVQLICESDSSDWINGPNFQTTQTVIGCDTPEGLETYSITDSSAQISWTLVDSATVYEVRLRMMGEMQWQLFSDLFSSDTLLSFLAASTTYEWQVRSQCSDTTSGWSIISSFRTLDDPDSDNCALPANLMTTFVNDSTVQFLWEGTDSAGFYQLRYKLQDEEQWSILLNVNGVDTVLAGFIADTLYEWQLRTICSPVDTSDNWTIPNTFLIPGPDTQCPAPMGLQALALSESEINFRWNEVMGISYYRFRYRQTGNTAWTIVDSLTSNNYLLSDLEPATSIDWAVSSICVGFDSEWIAGDRANTLKRPLVTITRPADSTSIEAGTDILLTAEASDSDGTITRVNFYYDNMLIAETGGETYSFNWENIPQGIYRVYAIAFDNDGLTDTSETIVLIVGYDPDNLLISDFIHEGEDLCLTDSATLILTNASIGAVSYEWDFGDDAYPATADSTGPYEVRYGSSGPKTITLAITGSDGRVNIKRETIEVYIKPLQPDAGPDTSVCGATYQMLAENPAEGIGGWNLLSGSGTFEVSNSPTTKVSDLTMGENVFTWKIINGACSSEPDTVVIFQEACAPVSPEFISGPDTVCISDINIVFTIPPDTSADQYNWIIPEGFEGQAEQNTLTISRVSGTEGVIQLTLENEIGESESLQKFVVVDSCLPPVLDPQFDLIDFSVFLKGEVIVLDWLVANERDILSYGVERSFDSVIFNTIETLPSTGNGEEEQKYRTLDEDAKTGITWYRIKITDMMGNVFYSQVIRFELGKNSPLGKVSLYPNPLRTGPLNISLDAQQPGEVRIKVANGAGQIIYDRIKIVTVGLNGYEIDCESWNNGIYYLQIKQENGTLEESYKVIKYVE